MKTITMPKLVKVICTECDSTDTAYWGEFGAEQRCYYCDTANVYLKRVGA